MALMFSSRVVLLYTLFHKHVRRNLMNEIVKWLGAAAPLFWVKFRIRASKPRFYAFLYNSLQEIGIFWTKTDRPPKI